jgi:Alfin
VCTHPLLYLVGLHDLCICAGEPNGTWQVDLPAEEVPAELPEPCLGINFARDGMQKKDWLALVAVHSDAWLLSVAFYYGAKLTADHRCVLLPGPSLLCYCAIMRHQDIVDLQAAIVYTNQLSTDTL